MLMDDGLLRPDNGRWVATGDLSEGRWRRPSRPSSPPASTGWRATSATRDRARGRRGQGLSPGLGPRSRRGPGARTGGSMSALARPEGAHPSRQGCLRGRGRLSLPARSDPRGGVRLDPEGAARAPARTLRGLARRRGWRSHGRVRGAARLPPRAGVRLSAAARPHRRVGTVDCLPWRQQAGGRGQASAHARRHACSRQSARAGRVASRKGERRTSPWSSTSGSRSASAVTCGRRTVCSARPSRPPKRPAMRRWQSEHGSNG